MDVSSRCGSDGYMQFLKCICDGLSSQAAMRNVIDAPKKSNRDYEPGEAHQ